MTGSLFDTYSGLPTLNTVASDFYALATSNETLKPFFDGVTMERLYHHQAAFLAVLMGAPDQSLHRSNYEGGPRTPPHNRESLRHHGDVSRTGTIWWGNRRSGYCYNA